MSPYAPKTDGLFHRMTAGVAVLLLAGQAVHGEDDTVADAVAQTARPQHAQQVIRLDDQMRGSLFGTLAGDEDKARQLLLSRTRLRASAANAVCDLTDHQRLKIDTAAEMDVERMFQDVETLLRRYRGRTIDLSKPENHPEWNRFHQDIHSMAMKLQGATDTGPLLVDSVISGALDDNQRGRWEEECRARTLFHWRAIVESGMDSLDLQLGLTSTQHDALRELLLDKPSGVDPLRFWQHGQGSQWSGFVCASRLQQIGEERVRVVLTDRQWKSLSASANAGIMQHLRQQKIILD